MSTDLGHSLSAPLAGSARTAPRPSRAWHLLRRMLQRLEHGALHVRHPDGAAEVFGRGGPQVHLFVHDQAVWGAVLRAGDIGFAQAYIDGQWQTDDLPGLLELLARNRAVLEAALYGSWWGGLAYRLRHLFRRNSKAGSRRNIHAHYDLGNAFYALWLDPSMTYSSAVFTTPGQTLQAAQQAKYRRILRQLGLPSTGVRVLEIGCGWGGFAELAAREACAHVTGLTLSERQLDYARRRLDEAGLAAHTDLRLQDYRDVAGQFDAIASIEMFEAVGEAYWPDYFACIARNLKRGGRACIQTITIAEPLFSRYRRGSDFIQQYIFPGGMLPAPSAFQCAAEAQGLRIVDTLAFGGDYARTLSLWRAAFHARSADVAAQGFDARFLRTWDFYLAYCEAGFRAGSIDVMQFTLEHR